MSNSSKLYNTLKTIDDGRKDCIAALNAAGANLPDTANFASIAANIGANVDVDPLPYPMPGVPMKPEDDPEMPEPFPEDYPDFEKILKSKKEIEVNGLSYYPGTIVVFQTDLPTTELFIKEGSQQEKEMTELEDGRIQVGMCYSYFQYKQTNPYFNTCIYVETSDDCAYTFATTRPDDSDITKTETKAKDISYIHTWNTDKDTVLNDGSHLKYIIIYYMYAGGTSNYMNNIYPGSQQNYSVDVVEIISCGWNALLHTQGGNTVYSTICTKKPYKRFTYMAPFTKNAYWGSSTSKYGLYSTKQNKMEQLVIKESEAYPISLYYSYSGTASYPTFRSPFLKTLSIYNKISDVKLVDTNATGTTFSYRDGEMLNLIYVKVNFGSYFNLPRVKYLYVNPEEQINSTIEAFYMPSLRNTNICAYIKNINYSGGNYSGLRIGTGGKNIVFENLETLAGSFNKDCGILPYENVLNLSFPKLKELNIVLLGNTSFALPSEKNMLNFPSLESINVAQTLKGRCVLVPKLKDVSNLQVGSNCEYIDISGCESGTLNLITKAQLLYIKFPETITLTEINLDRDHNLSHDFLIDMFNRLMIVEDGSTHTLTLSDLKLLCTDEELAIVTNKGWTLK